MIHKTTELSRPVELRSVLENEEISLDIRATAEECRALAKRFDILEVEDLNAFLTIRPGANPALITVEGEIMAHVVQACCVTLAPVKEVVQDSFSDLLTTDPELLGSDEEEDEDSDKPVELIRSDNIDIGEIVAQWLSLALNPYPRSDAPLYEHVEQNTESGTHTPLDVLGNLKGK